MEVLGTFDSVSAYTANPKEPESKRDVLEYSGKEPVELAGDESAWISVKRLRGSQVQSRTQVEAVLPVADDQFSVPEASPGLWPSLTNDGYVLVTAGPEGNKITTGDTVAALAAGSARMGQCRECGGLDTLFVPGDLQDCDRCDVCGCVLGRRGTCCNRCRRW